jgi:photosystem II stability/assembly factor-like uncharacterized protein
MRTPPPLVALAGSLTMGVSLGLLYLVRPPLLAGPATPEMFRAPVLPVQPAPTEHWLGEGAEQKNSTARKAWIKSMHRAPPEFDPEKVERTNGLAQIAKRNALAGQPAPPSTVAGQWIERGSANQAGRTHVALHNPDGALVVGSAKGGLWRRESDGWVPFGDNLYGGAHHLVAWEHPRGSTIYLAATDGGLVHWTQDDGTTWQKSRGLEGVYQVKRLLRSVTSDTCWLVGATWTGAWEYSLYRSTDRGTSFQPILRAGRYGIDVWISRTGPGPLFLARDGVVSTSVNEGDTFAEVGSLPGPGSGSWSATWLVGSEAGAPRLWAVSEANRRRRLHRSDDAGFSWIDVTEVDDWWGTLAASTVDPDLFAWGGVELHLTTDGSRFRILNPWGAYYADPANKLHADIPGLDVVPDGRGQETWYISTDGGTYASTDGLVTVDNLALDGLRISQYYDVLTSSADPDHVAAGSQDQGYQSTQRLAGQDDELYEMEQVLSGDYGHLTSSDGSHEVVYSVYPGFMLVASGENEARLAYVDFPPDGGNHGWLPPIVADPRDPLAVFWGGERLYRYVFDRGTATWSPSVHSTQSFAASNGEYISAFTFSPINPDRGLLATSAGRLFWTVDGGRSWAPSTGSIQGQYFYGQSLVLSAEDVNLGYAGGSGYGNPGVLRTLDGGRTWEAWDQGLPDTLVYALAEARDGSGRIYAGTETSAYLRRRDQGEWVDLTADIAPVTTYWSVEVLAHENTARFGTYGRGIWDFQMDPAATGCVQDQDDDRDGSACDADCDDADPTRHPDAADPCDTLDQDCDPTTAPTDDRDGDGHLSCNDCDDNNAEVYPGARERRGNDVDEDCDGEANRRCGCSTAEPGLVWAILAPVLLLRRRRLGTTTRQA